MKTLLYALAIACQREERASIARARIVDTICSFLIVYCNDVGVSKGHVIERLNSGRWKHD